MKLPTPSQLLKTLVAIPSVNPMGRALTGPEYYEGRMSDYLETFFRDLGVPWQRIEVAPGRANVIACCEAPGARRTVLLDAHQDTVPVDGMTIAPFEPEEREGRIYGRGSCDVKGGMAAMLTAFARLVLEQPANRAHVVMSCTCDEEATSLGVNDLVRLWSDPERSGSLLSKQPEVAIVSEPTELDIVLAHRGATRWKIKTIGRACHSSEPHNGINAIYRMAPIISALERYAADLPAKIAPHPLCGPATLSVGRIEGGISVNTVPDTCSIEVDRRVIPGEDGQRAIEDVAQLLAQKNLECEFLPPWIMSPPLPDDDNHPLGDELMEHVTAVAGARKHIGVPYGTHASRIAAAGVPAVVFGPGSIAQAHTKNEWIDIAQLDAASEIYFRYCAAAGK